MSNAATFRKKASVFEQLKQIDQAIAMYARAIEESESEGEDVEVALYNKVGDLALRQGRVSDAMTYFDRAVERYASSGLLNNAIALCNKILRSDPGRVNVYLTLGRISAQKGLRGDATRYFHEYATRQQQEGRLDEGIRALAEVLDHMPELNDVRIMVEDLAVRSGLDLPRRLTPLRSERIPTPASSPALRVERPQDLVFLDIEDGAAATSPAEGRESASPAATLVSLPPESMASPAMAGLPLLEIWGAPDGLEANGCFPDQGEEQWAPTGVPGRLDAQVFIHTGELPPLLLDDAVVDAGLVAGRAEDASRDGSSAGVVEEPAAPPSILSAGDTPPLSLAAVAEPTGGVANASRDTLRALVARLPKDWLLRRRLAEALLAAGEHEAAWHELETAQLGYVTDGDLGAAADIADELVHACPDGVGYHQKRVELAVRCGDQQRLCRAYLDLADALVRLYGDGRARAVYRRVLEIDPHDERARRALGITAPPPLDLSAPRDDDSCVEWDGWWHAGEESVSTRMRAGEATVSGDGPADLEARARLFKEGVSHSLGEDDVESRYDLGVAYQAMGFLDDAIAEFRKALRSRTHRLPAYEALGQCFVEQERYQVAVSVLSRALREPGLGEEKRIGVLYLLGHSCEALQRKEEARGYFQRVHATDINFRDVAARLAVIEQALR